MKYNDYANIRADEVLRRLRQKRGNNVMRGPIDVVPVLLRYAIVYPLYKTRHTDPIDAVVELLDKIIPTTPVDELERRVQNDDVEAAHDLCILYMFNLRGVKHDCEKIETLMTFIHHNAAKNDSVSDKVFANVVAYLHTQHLDCPCKMHEHYEIMYFRKIMRNKGHQMLLEMLALGDYACPLSLLDAVHSLRCNTNTSCVRPFLRNHPEAFRYFRKAVSVRCNNKDCTEGYCMSGAMVQCQVCGMPYCCVDCRDDARATHAAVCRPELRHIVSRVFPNGPSSTPKNWLEHVLDMFGIVLPPGNYEDVLTVPTLSLRPHWSILAPRVNEYYSKRLYLCASTFATAVLRE